MIDRKKLDQWENKLCRVIGEGDLLLGELEHSRSDLDEIGVLFRNTVFLQLRRNQYNIDEALRYIRSQCPLTFAFYLVLEGIYHYESGDFWHGPREQLGIQQNHTYRCGQLYLDILVKHNLPTFEQSGGQTYVTPILLHGGIPNDHLERFFDFLLRYEVQPHRIAVNAEDLLSVWRREPGAHLIYLSKPIQRFLRFGGNVATDFVARCLELFNVTTEDETFEFDLPERVRQAFWQWREKHEEQLQKRLSRPPIRLQKPILTIAPYSTGISLYLPPQQLPTQNAPQELIWKISSDNHVQRVNCNRQRGESGYAYAPLQDVFVRPEAQYRIQLEANGDVLQTWLIDGIGDPPLLIFEPYDDYGGDTLTQDERHHPGRRWLLYPQDFQLTAPGRKIRDLPGLAGNWQSYRLEEWELQSGELKLVHEQKKTYSFPLIRESGRRPPRLIGENRLQLFATRADFPLYNGRPPHLIIPTTQPHRWRVAIRAEGASQPDGYQHYQVSKLPFVQRNGELWIDLASQELLGDSPIGKFEIVARGPLGRSRSLGLRIVPHLEIAGHDAMYLAEANQPASFRVACDKQMWLRQSPPQEGVDIQEDGTTEDKRSYTILVQSHIQQLSLQLSHERGPKIPLTLPIHRLRWGIKRESGIETQWHTRPYAFYPDGLPASAELRINVPLVADELLQVGWRLIKADGKVLRQVNPGELRVQRRMRVSMIEVMATWREYQETLCWQIIIQKENVELPIVVDTFYLLPELNLGDLDYQWNTGAEQVHLTLCWEQPQLGSRQLRLWPLDRPWAKPVTRLIQTTDTLTEWQFTNEELPTEAYLAEITIHNPWASQRPQRPKHEQPNTLFIKPPGIDGRYAHLLRLRDAQKATPEQLIALLIHQHYNGQEDEMYKTNQYLVNQVASLPVMWLIRWANVVSALDKNAYTIAQIKIFTPSVVEQLAKDNANLDLLRQLFEHLSDKYIEKQGVWILQSGLRGRRRHCIESLCCLPLDNQERQDAFRIAMEALLEDVMNGSLLVAEAVDIMRENAPKAASYLVQEGGQDASELLRYLTQKANLEPTWVWVNMILHTNIGDVVIRKLRHRQTSAICICTALKSNCYADSYLKDEDDRQMSVRLDLQNQLLHFDGYEPYRCQHCQQIYRDMVSYKKHHQESHTDLTENRKRIKRDIKLAFIQPVVPSEEEL